jgi:hypothetical protein
MPNANDAAKPGQDSPDQILQRLNEKVASGATDKMYEDVRALTQTPEGFAKVKELFNSDSFASYRPGITNSYMKDKLGNKTNFEAFAGADGQLTLGEIGTAQHKRRIDELIMAPISSQSGFDWYAKGDGKNDVLSIQDFEAQSAKTDSRRAAASIGQAFPNKEKFLEKLDATRDGQVTMADLNAFDRTPEQLAKIPKDKLPEALQTLAGVRELKNNFARIAEPGSQAITFDNVSNFIAEANGNPVAKVSPLDANYKALVDNFNDLTSAEKVPGKDEKRINPLKLGDDISIAAENIAQNKDREANKALHAGLTDLQARSWNVANINKTDGVGGTNISLEDIKADYQLNKAYEEARNFVEDKSVFGPMSPEDCAKKLNALLATERASAALAPSEQTARKIEVLELLSKFYGDPTNFPSVPAPPAPKPGS